MYGGCNVGISIDGPIESSASYSSSQVALLSVVMGFIYQTLII
jgi:hypothetical protein